MENKHTPGPWHPVYISGVCTSIGNTDGDGYYELIADMILPETDAEYEEQKANIEANAKLIAAAPEMLDALIAAKDAIDDLMDIADGYDKDLEKVLSAIKKATGAI